MHENTHNNFPYSLLQQFDFGTSTTDAPAEASKDELEEEVATELQIEAHLNADNQSNQPKEEGAKSIIDSASTEADEDPKTELEDPPKRTSSKSRKKHIMREEDDEHSEEPPIPVLSRKDKEKVNNPSASEDEVEDIDIELEAPATRVTCTSTETKHLLDIITVITG